MNVWYVVILMAASQVCVSTLLFIVWARTDRRIKRVLALTKRTLDTMDTMTEHNKVRDALIVTLWRAVGLTAEELPGDN